MWDYVAVRFLPSAWRVQLATMDSGETWSGESVRVLVPERLPDGKPLLADLVVEWLLSHHAKLLTRSEHLIRFNYSDTEIIVSSDSDEVAMIECRFALRRRSNIDLDKWVQFVASWPNDWDLQILYDNAQSTCAITDLKDYLVQTPVWQRYAAKYNWN